MATKQTHIDLNAVRTLAIFGVVLQHTMGLFNSHAPVLAGHVLYGVPSLTVLLLFSGMTMGIMRMPVTLREYPQYLRAYALPHLRVYTVFFLVQTTLVVTNWRVGIDGQGMGSEPFDFAAIARAYVLADGYGSVAVWYMHMLAVASAIWPMTRLVRRVPVWAVVGGLLAIGGCPPVANSDLASRTLYCMAVVYLGRRAGWLRTGNHGRRAWIFGCLYVAIAVPFLVLSLDHTLPYYSWSFGANTISYLLVTASRFCGAFFLISAVGMIGNRLSGLRVWFAKGTQASLYIYLTHRAVQLACLGLLVNYARPAMESWGTIPRCAVALLGAVLLAAVGYGVEEVARHHPWLDYLVFGKGQKPPSRPWPWQKAQTINCDAGRSGSAQDGPIRAKASS